MKEKHFCRCCLSEECYKDMANNYNIGNKTENYFEMLLNIFNINLSNNDAQRYFICEECVKKLRDAAAFKTKVLNVQETIKKNLSWAINDTKMEVVENADYFDDFDDNISDSFNDEDFLWDNFTQGSSQKGKVFVITLNSKEKTQYKPKTISKFDKKKSYEIEQGESTIKNSSKLVPKVKDKAENSGILETNEDDNDDMNTDGFDSEDDVFNIAINSKDVTKRTPAKTIMKTKTVSAKQNKEKVNRTKAKRREIPQTELRLKHKSENTLKLVQNSNVCLFRSLQNKFGCNFCQMKFPEFSQLREHSLTHTNPKMIALKRLRGLSWKNAEISDLKCNLCSENCNVLPELMEHLKNKHEISFHGTEHYLVPYKLQDGFQCVLCELKFHSYMRLSVHMNIHYTNNVCEICGISFINRKGLRAHVQSQHKEKKCSQCPAIFFTNSSRSKHLRQAHGIRNMKRYCNLCNKIFRYSYMLNEHKIQEHGLKRPICSCVECGKTFLSPVNLKTHVRSVHIKERNYPCTKCGLRFFTKCDQKRHERTHEDVRSFCCSYCEAKFKSKDSWRRHLKRQHGHVFVETS